MSAAERMLELVTDVENSLAEVQRRREDLDEERKLLRSDLGQDVTINERFENIDDRLFLIEEALDRVTDALRLMVAEMEARR